MRKTLIIGTALTLALAAGLFFMTHGKPANANIDPDIDTVISAADISSSSATHAPVEGWAEQNYTLTPGDQGLLLSLLYRAFPEEHENRLTDLHERWTPAYIAPALELFNFVPHPDTREVIIDRLTATTGQDFGSDTNAWYRWLWNQPELKVAGYDNFKAEFYREIDPKFETYFRDRAATARIRLDEIRWGGVLQDGIPPLRNPEMIAASDADYLDDDNIIFGIEVNGEPRAYPKRILAWHEMFLDTVGGEPVAGVYCTLCGTVILYETHYEGTPHGLGTSGFLYRSNKLMYDQETQSLWNTIKGEPVLGPLVGQNIALNHQSVVTTTWGEWKRRHPTTQVLSLNTGHQRDYGEGVAYHQYFATDDLMFNTPYNDIRLKNKDEVLALRFKKYPREQLAISADFLAQNPLYKDKVGEQSVLVLTDNTGGNRVYDPQNIDFRTYDPDSDHLIDARGQKWTLSESQLVSESGDILKRLPYHRAFWFGWHATYPNSRLVK